jgi:DNA-binding transcriptional ArsR family regulator
MNVTSWLVAPILIVSLALATVPVYQPGPSFAPVIPGASGDCRTTMPCCANNGASQAAPSTPVRAPVPLPCCQPCQVPVAIPSVNSPVNLVTETRFRGFRRVTVSNVLDHPERRQIIQIIRENPGIDFARLTQDSGMNINTLRYHIDTLAHHGKVTVSRCSGILRYFENHGRYTEFEKSALSYQRNPASMSLLSVLVEFPGVSQNSLAESMGITSPTVRWHMQRFESDGIVRSVREGRNILYYLTPEASAFFLK